ncbi:MAG: hypothetical protein LBF97_08270 [Elusimicrobiota bacterium]|jgi:hypothetical protein|nr:hypothetical protein [Elusimicrobiota bacterium]
MANEFYNSLINTFRGIRQSINTYGDKYYTFGTICNGSYLNWKHDPNPSVFVLHGGEPGYNLKKMVHGINLHYMPSGDQYRFIRTLYLAYRGQQIISKPLMYQYLKLNFPNIIKQCYRMYHLEMCDFKIISPGITQIPLSSCYPIKDRRDGIIATFNNQITKTTTVLENRQIAYNQDELNQHIQESLNSRKIL